MYNIIRKPASVEYSNLSLTWYPDYVCSDDSDSEDEESDSCICTIM